MPWLQRFCDGVSVPNRFARMASLIFAGLCGPSARLPRGAALASLILAARLFVCAADKSLETSAARPASGRPAAPVVSEEKANSVGFSMQGNPLDSTNIMRTFLARGVIRVVPEDGQTLVIRHEAIPGFMPQMTMEFNVRNTNEVRGFQAGDAIAFRVRANQQESWIEDLKRIGTNELTAPLAADPPSATLLHAAQLKPGDLLPDAELLTEDGRTIRFSDFAGQALAFTFIFTRCPMPDFCPRMNQNFSRARELLRNNPAAPAHWQFLSISFDPGFDKPGVLSGYAYSYRGKDAGGWLFAVAPTNVLDQIAPQLDFRFATSGASFFHNLRTVVIDSQRRIYRQFEGNKWTAEELAAALTEAALVKAPISPTASK